MIFVNLRNCLKIVCCMGSVVLIGSLVIVMHNTSPHRQMQDALNEEGGYCATMHNNVTGSQEYLPETFVRFTRHISSGHFIGHGKLKANHHRKKPTKTGAESTFQPKSCLLDDRIPSMILFVSSRPSSADMRAAIRETWGLTAASCGVKVIFGFGKQTNRKVQALISTESVMYGDVLQSSRVRDGYRNQTALVLSFFHWATEHCKAPLVAKADDDTWINFPLIMPFLKTLHYDHFMVGFHFQSGTNVIRDTRHAQFLTKAEYYADLFPVYASGILYVFSAATLPALLRTAFHVRQHWIDDVYITGDLIEEINKKCTTKTISSSICIQRVNFWGLATWPDLRASPGCHLINSTAMHKIDPLTKRLAFYLPCLENLRLCA